MSNKLPQLKNINDYLPIKKYLPFFREEFLSLIVVSIDMLNTVETYNKEHGVCDKLNLSTVEIKKNDTNYVINLNLGKYDKQATAFASPEQLGLIDTGVDFRSDFFSLGVILYASVSESDPVVDDNHRLLIDFKGNKHVPNAFLRIIEKMTSYYPKDRYQSYVGLVFDLKKCQESYESTGNVDYFLPGAKDFSSAIEFLDILYGRNAEQHIIQQVMEQVDQGTPGVLFLSGYEGVGKTVLIEETLKKVKGRKKIILRGKYDQTINAPYSAIIEALKHLIKQLKSEAEHVEFWKHDLAQTVFPNANLLINFVPELDALLGQGHLTKMADIEQAKYRFEDAFIKLFNFLSQKYFLVLFLDDLQWVDDPSLKLIELLMYRATGRCLILGAYRDTDKIQTAKLTTLIEELKVVTSLSGSKGKGDMQTETIHAENIEQLHLQGLQEEDVWELIGDTLRSNESSIQHLSKQIFKKTLGNPFFIKQQLIRLHEQTVIVFDGEKWTWSLKDIQETCVSDNVANLMADRIELLSEKARQAVTYAAFLGHAFSVIDLTVILQSERENVELELWHAVHNEFIVPIDGNNAYIFIHDRIQQAAYELMPSEKVCQTHFMIGMMLYKYYCNDEKGLNDNLLHIIEHLNKGKNSANNKQEKMRISSLNLKAAKQAQKSSAFEKALHLYLEGLSLISDTDWGNKYQLCFDLHYGKMVCDHVCGNIEDAELISSYLISKSKTGLEKANILLRRSIIYTNLGQYDVAIQSGLRGLEILGEKVSVKTNLISGLFSFFLLKRKLSKKSKEDFLNQPEVIDETQAMTLHLLVNIGPAAFLSSNEYLWVKIVVKLVSLIQRYGYIKDGSIGYVFFGIIVGTLFKDYHFGYVLSQIGFELDEKYENTQYLNRHSLSAGAAINHWRESFVHCHELIDQSYDLSIVHGDITYAVYALVIKCSLNFVTGLPMTKFDLFCVDAITYIDKTRFKDFSYSIKTGQIMIELLQGKLTQSDLDETNNDYLENTSPVHIFFYAVMNLMVAYLLNDDAESQRWLTDCQKYNHAGQPFPTYTEYYFYETLHFFRLIDIEKNVIKKYRYKRVITKNIKRMALWAENCPDNYHHKWALLNAEHARLKQQHNKAFFYYEEALTYAKKGNFIHHVGVIQECLGRFYDDQHEHQKACGSFKKAIAAYDAWGATLKVAKIKQGFPSL